MLTLFVSKPEPAVDVGRGRSEGPGILTLDRIRSGLFTPDHGPKVEGQAVDKLKKDLETSGIASEIVDRLVTNVHGVGYRLNLPASHISVERDG
jgi:hypothetical protein